MRILYVHIGTHKTGTSSIQGFFKRNRFSLIKNGLCYPCSGMNSIGSHHNLVYQTSKDSRYLSQRGTWDDLRNEIKSTLCDNPSADFLISCEAFSSSSKYFESIFEELDKVSCDNDLKIMPVLFLRSFPEFLESIYFERIKGGGRALRFTDFVNNCLSNNSFSYSRIINDWSRFSGGLTIFPYDEMCSITKLLKNIATNVDSENLSFGQRSNERICSEHLALISGHTESALSFGFDKRKCREFSRFFRKQCGFDSKKEDFRLMTASDKEVIDRYLFSDLNELNFDLLFEDDCSLPDFLYSYSKPFAEMKDVDSFYRKVDSYKKMFDGFMG